jgi:hypothetical protein
LRLRLRGFRLAQLLIEFGRLNLRKQLSAFHAPPDVDIPVFDVSVGAGIDGRFGVRLNVRGKAYFELRSTGLRMAGAHGHSSMVTRICS